MTVALTGNGLTSEQPHDVSLRRWQQKLAPHIEAVAARIGQNAFADLLR